MDQRREVERQERLLAARDALVTIASMNRVQRRERGFKRPLTRYLEQLRRVLDDLGKTS